MPKRKAISIAGVVRKACKQTQSSRSEQDVCSPDELCEIQECNRLIQFNLSIVVIAYNYEAAMGYLIVKILDRHQVWKIFLKQVWATQHHVGISQKFRGKTVPAFLALDPRTNSQLFWKPTPVLLLILAGAGFQCSRK